MRPIERDVLLCLLAVSAGSADGWSYFGLGHAFVANMTGNTVLLGMSVFQEHGDPLHPIISLTCYAAGVMTGSLLMRNIDAESSGRVWTPKISQTLLLESLLLICAQTGWAIIHSRPGASFPVHDLLLGCVAFAIGLQSAAMLQLNIPGIVTTYLTGTWTTLINGLAGLKRKPPPGREREQQKKFEERLLMQAVILTVYFLSAVLTGWLFRYLPVVVGVLPALSVLLVAVYGFTRSQEAPGLSGSI
ncbi:MAG TPA: YoaK family protein [Silvibacterium sp.]|nr:YoaK family protein [Silvibacterium sp.]